MLLESAHQSPPPRFFFPTWGIIAVTDIWLMDKWKLALTDRQLLKRKECIVWTEERADLSGEREGWTSVIRCLRMRGMMEEVKREGGGGGWWLWSVKRRGTAGAVVVKVTSLPCEVEWYLNLTFAGTMSPHCHSSACVEEHACLFRGSQTVRSWILQDPLCTHKLTHTFKLGIATLSHMFIH